MGIVVLIMAVIGILMVSPFFARMIEADILKEEAEIAENNEKTTICDENIKNDDEKCVFDPDPGEKLRKRIITEQLNICDGCPYEYLSIFLEETDRRSASEIHKYYKVKCTHQLSCMRAEYMAKHGMD